MLSANVTTDDRRRAARAVLGWLSEDKEMVDLVLTEAIEDDRGAAPLVLALLDLCTVTARLASPDAAKELRKLVLFYAQHEDGEGKGV